ncbi:MAG: pitrilysin family protein [Patescibacteria group bacterium]
MKYVYKKHPSRMASLVVALGAGSRVEFDTKYPKGMAHFVEHIVFKGTENFESKDLLWKISLAGGSCNAFTDKDLVCYHISLPEENIEVAFQCLSEIVNRPTFLDKEIKKEKDVVCQEIKMYQDDDYDLIEQEISRHVFKDSSLGSPICGFEESVKSITKSDLKDFYKQFYGFDNQLIVLSASNDYTNLLEKYFGVPNNILTWPTKNPVKYNIPLNTVVERRGQSQNIIQISFGGPNLHNFTKQDAAKLRVFNYIFGGNESSRLFIKIREDMGLVYGIHSSLEENMDGSLFEIVTSTEPENIDAVLEEINNQIELMTESILDTELECAKNKLKSTEYTANDSSLDAACRIIDEVFYGEVGTEEYLSNIDKVTIDEIKDVAKKIFGENRYQIIGCNK